MSNFDFLQSEWNDIYQLTKEAESCIWSKPTYACLINRKALERAVVWMYKNDADLTLPYDTTLNSLLREESFAKVVPTVFIPKVNIVKKLGNIAAHESTPLSDTDAINSTRELFHFLYWFYFTYSVEEPVTGLKFDETIIPRVSPEQAEIERLKKEIEKREQELLEKADLEKENQELLEKVKQIKAKERELPKDYDYSEAQTRKYYIDVLLKEVGWDISQANATEYEVQGMPNPSGLGYVDYVLWGDNGKPVGLVEAKKTMRDAKIGREQAELYANCLEKKFGQRPIMFYSNGYKHYIWDDTNYPEREVAGFYSKDDLQRLINRRDTRKDLINVELNKDIAGRPYQERCIKSVCENFQNKNRKSLLVMATGTGKTRVSISIVDILTRYNWAKRVLFLADRIPLVVQAQRACASVMPDLNPVNLLDTDDNVTNSRFVVSTYQTMMNLIDAKKSDRKLYSVGYFDLIIVDEAHRSIYKRYGEIFNYFDALMLGLTATPKNGIDKNTYKVFDLPKGVPTDCYEYKEAVEQGYLVPYEVIDTSTKFLREGIKYSELSEDEKDEYETLFYDEETGTLPDAINSAKLNKWLFNADTVDKILENLMINGIKVQGGNKLGKTIIFATNQKHADFIAERFDKSYKQYNGKFARVITYKTEYAQNLIDEFSVNEKEPTIAISVDKLDTGVDVLGVVNLVFFKPVRSYTKFIQMIGRGTRLCPNLFGPNDDKKKFYIFDACGNFEYFDNNPPKSEGGETLSLDEALFIKRLSLAETIKDDDDKLKEYSAELKDGLHNIVKTLNRDNFIVRRYLEDVDKFSDRAIWNKLEDTDLTTITGSIAKLPTTLSEGNELTKRFDLLMLNMQMALYSGVLDKFEKYKTKLIIIANLLEAKASIPQVKKHIELICDIQSDEYWEGISILELEEIRKKLRNLVDVLDYDKQEIVYTDFTDELSSTDTTIIDSGVPEADIDRVQYEKKVKAFLKEHENEIAINKLKFNKPLTELDFQQLVKILKENADIVGTEDKFKMLVGDLGLGEFIRKVIGLESSEIEQVFAQYLDANTFNVNQIRFIEQIIAYLKINGTMLNLGSLFESPFIDMNSDSIYGVFSSKDVDNIVSLIKGINENANLRKFM